MKLVMFSKKDKEIEVLKNFLKAEDNTFYPPLHDRGSMEEFFQEMLKGKVLYFFENKIIAFINYFESYPKYDTAYIAYLAVLPNYRNHHLGEKLMKECIQKLKLAKAKKVTITTWSTDDPAIHLYKKLEFKIKKVIENDRGEGVHTLVLEKDL